MEKTFIVNEKISLGGEKPLVILSLDLPVLKGTDCVTAYAEALRTGFLSYGEKKLLPKAERESADEGFKPYGAVLKTVIGFENDSLLSLYTDGIVTVGERRRIHRISRLWHKETGVILPYKSLFGKKSLLPLLEGAAEGYEGEGALYADWAKQLRRLFNKKQFYLCPKGVAFYYQSGELSSKNSPLSLYLDKKALAPFLTEKGKELFGE